MNQKAFIIKTCEVKTILESEVISGEKIHYMKDGTSYSNKQIFNLNKKLTVLEKVLICLSFSTEKLKKMFDRKVEQSKKENKVLLELFADENFKKEMKKRYEELKKSKSTD